MYYAPFESQWWNRTRVGRKIGHRKPFRGKDKKCISQNDSQKQVKRVQNAPQFRIEDSMQTRH